MLETNFNKKLDCDIIPHLSLAPGELVSESTMEQTVITIQTQDGSHEPVNVKLIDLWRLPSDLLNSTMTWTSHGMDAADYWKWLCAQFPGKDLSKLALYFYKKI